MDQLLTLARLEPNQTVQREAVDLQALVVNVVAELAPTAIAKDVDLQLAPRVAMAVAGSPGLLAIMVHNLIDNAIRYTARHSAVQVAVTPTGDGAEFSVLDRDRAFRRTSSVVCGTASIGCWAAVRPGAAWGCPLSSASLNFTTLRCRSHRVRAAPDSMSECTSPANRRTAERSSTRRLIQ